MNAFFLPLSPFIVEEPNFKIPTVVAEGVDDVVKTEPYSHIMDYLIIYHAIVTKGAHIEEFLREVYDLIRRVFRMIVNDLIRELRVRRVTSGRLSPISD